MSDSLGLFDDCESGFDGLKGGWLSTTDEKPIECSNFQQHQPAVMDTSNTLDAINEILFACDVAENNCTQGKHLRYILSY